MERHGMHTVKLQFSKNLLVFFSLYHSNYFSISIQLLLHFLVYWLHLTRVFFFFFFFIEKKRKSFYHKEMRMRWEERFTMNTTRWICPADFTFSLASKSILNSFNLSWHSTPNTDSIFGDHARLFADQMKTV